jgi:hypothetical protein
MGFEHFTKLIQNTTPLTHYKLMEHKLQLIWVKRISKNHITVY